MAEIAKQMKDFIETHDLVRNHIKILKKYKDKRKMLETDIIKELENQNVSVVNLNENKRIIAIRIRRGSRCIISEAFYRPCSFI